MVKLGYRYGSAVVGFGGLESLEADLSRTINGVLLSFEPLSFIASLPRHLLQTEPWNTNRTFGFSILDLSQTDCFRVMSPRN